MQNQNQQQNLQGSPQMPSQQDFGGHDMFDAHEALSTLTGGLEQYLLYEQHIQDQELMGIAQRHRAFCTQLYNTICETFKSGQDPTVKTQSYEMEQNNNVIYGMKPSSSKTPSQSVNELNDQCISGFMLGQLKSTASAFTMTALEMTNPVLRRIFADSIPNVIEMAYEVFLYQNKHQYYQVPQLNQQDMQAFQNSYAPVQGTMPH
ncbi:spore coat protein F-like protein YhcQ [Lentibacillus populi]|uniref:Spore coat protein F-like protein YhcQ n=1 Tax=Lentibacillus populi TaxID=1827502 RepID=A0A9W5TZ53_9BACI|nr:spore coat protein [Lentibacillus populi]GGB47847.1 spore coat protein F-like protein YhcQ [Lentibacillus populi]